MKNVEKVLLHTGKVTKGEIDSAFDRFNHDSEKVWRSFVADGRLTEIEVFNTLADVLSLEFVDIRYMEISVEALASLPAAICRKERLLPLSVKGNYLFIGTDNPNNFRAIDTITASSNKTVVVKVVAPSTLQDMLNRHYRADEEIDKLSEELEQVSTDETETVDEVSDSDESPIVRFVNLLIAQAIQDRASDIHVEPGENELKIRYRIDGVLHVIQKADKTIQRGVISRLKVMSEIDIAERRKPQDGRMSIKHGGKSIDIRVVTLPVIWGEKVIMRILDHSSEKRDITSIGMSPRNEKIFRNAISKPHGMVLVTGPTGSGKSTTNYVVLEEISNDSVNVITVENPIEKRIAGVAQMQTNPKAGMTFDAVLPAILRSDPDIVLVGEIRDTETARLAIDASMTGHLVLSTLHTNGAPETAARLVEMGVDPYLVGSSVSCVLAQRLARRLCTDCKIESTDDAELRERVGFPYPDETIYVPVGCVNCSNTGFRGRIALTEVMEVSDEIEALINAGNSATVIRRAAEASGLVPLRDDGWLKVKMGITTIEEILRVTS